MSRKTGQLDQRLSVKRLKTSVQTNDPRLAFRTLVDILEPISPPLLSSWKNIVDRQEQLVVFYEVDYQHFVPRLSKCLRIQCDRSVSSRQECLIPSVFFGQTIDHSFVERTLGRSYLKQYSDLQALMNAADGVKDAPNTPGNSDGEEDDNDQELNIANNYTGNMEISSVDDITYPFLASSLLPSFESSADLDEQVTGTGGDGEMKIGPEEEPPEKLWKNDDYSESSDISSHANASIQLKLPRTIGKTGGRIPIVPAETTRFRKILPKPTGIPVERPAPKTRHRSTLLADMKEPLIPVPRGYLTPYDSTSPWAFQVHLLGWTCLHPTIPNVMVEAAALSKLRDRCKRSSAQYKWFLFILLLGGTRGLARMCSVWKLNKKYQFDSILGESFMDAIYAHQAELDRSQFLTESATERSSLQSFLSDRFATWRSQNHSFLRACGVHLSSCTVPGDEVANAPTTAVSHRT